MGNMEQKISSRIVGVRFSKVGKVYHFDAKKIESFRVGDVAVVETSRGWQLGEIIVIVENPVSPPEGTWKQLDRLASPKDLLQRQSWQAKEQDVAEYSKKRVRELKLVGIKIVMSEYSYDGSKLTIFFSSDSEDKVELKSLRSDMQRAYAPAQVDLRQIGPRDVAKILGGMGACGLESRCCSQFITEFSSISIRMAKEQGISLTPTEITGMCGRLRCCLIYEFENYVEARKLLPKKNKRMITPDGVGKVIDVSPIREMVLIELPEIGRKEYHKDLLKPADELEAFENKANSGSSGHGGGGCGQCKQR
ncbi:MAG: regulatory iron-sulfur-containing complex subunit RicT [Chloroflexi bacterium]|nr:regulatory iron-sulfur-containing complex subunit RicT [Chloroflexota bacterium]